jgi:hypothetical protein
MSRREKILAAVVGGFVAFLVLYMIVDGLLISPARALTSQEADLTRKIAEAQSAVSMRPAYEARITKIAGQTLRASESEAQEYLYQRLKLLLYEMEKRANLRTVSPVQVSSRPRTGPARSTTLTCQIDVEGLLPGVVDLLYVLSREPYLGRIEELSITPDRADRGRSGQVTARIRLATLLLSGRGGQVKPSEGAPDLEGLLTSADRGEFDAIVRRNIFLPYRQVRPTYVRRETPAPARPSSPAPQPAARPVGRYRLAGGLTARADEFCIETRDAEGRTKYTYHKPGEEVAGWEVVAIDLTPRPNPNREGRLSDWRIIVRRRGEFRAVEAGEFMYQKHPIKPEDLPEALRVTPAEPETAGAGK